MFFNKFDRSLVSRTCITRKFKMLWFPNEASYCPEKLQTDINMPPLLPDEDKNFGGSLVLDFRKWWRHVKTIYKSLLREDSSFSFMPYYPSDLKSLSHTNAVKTCAMSVQTPPVQCAPYLTPLLSGPTFNVALLSRAAWLSVFALCFANTAVVSRRKNSLR